MFIKCFEKLARILCCKYYKINGLGILGFLNRDSQIWVSLPKAPSPQCWVKEGVVGKMEKGFDWHLDQSLSSTEPQEQYPKSPS